MFKLLLLVIAIALSGCNCEDTSHNNDKPHIDIADAGALADSSLPVASFLNGDDWEIALPGGWKITESPDPSVKLFALNNTGNNILSLEKLLTSSSYDKFVLERIRFLRDMEADILVTKSVQLNSHPFVMIESYQNNLRVWTWVTTKNNVGFIITCGGLDLESKSNHIVCDVVADSFKIRL